MEGRKTRRKRGGLGQIQEATRARAYRRTVGQLLIRVALCATSAVAVAAAAIRRTHADARRHRFAAEGQRRRVRGRLARAWSGTGLVKKRVSEVGTGVGSEKNHSLRATETQSNREERSCTQQGKRMCLYIGKRAVRLVI